MKRRFGYVSNSSSSSFVVVPDSVVEEFNSDYERHLMESYERLRTTMEFSHVEKGWCGLFADAQTTFSWEQVLYHGLKDKWNWLVLQAYYWGGNVYRQRLDSFVESLQLGLKIDWRKIERRVQDDFTAYIDHQSIDPVDTFNEVDKVGIDEFLTNPKCHIHNSNDNVDEEEEGDFEERW